MKKTNKSSQKKRAKNGRKPVRSSAWLGADMIKEERVRQINGEGWTAGHDDRHESGEMCDAAIYYALAAAKQARVLVGLLSRVDVMLKEAHRMQDVAWRQNLGPQEDFWNGRVDALVDVQLLLEMLADETPRAANGPGSAASGPKGCSSVAAGGSAPAGGTNE